jgi:hypothetical protein
MTWHGMKEWMRYITMRTTLNGLSVITTELLPYVPTTRFSSWRHVTPVYGVNAAAY